MVLAAVFTTVLLGTGCQNAAAEKSTSVNKSSSDKNVTKGGISNMTVTSENINDGVWDEMISNTSSGANVSPELDWSAVDGATEYAVYMIDPDGHNWLHWRVTGFKGTHLKEGETTENSEYIGPYPPSGTHRYIVTVYALKAEPDSIPGKFDSANVSTDNIEKVLDISDGKTGNIIAKGKLEGTYSAKKR